MRSYLQNNFIKTDEISQWCYLDKYELTVMETSVHYYFQEGCGSHPAKFMIRNEEIMFAREEMHRYLVARETN
jgi:hypothetical protein